MTGGIRAESNNGAARALLASMKAVQQALSHPGGLPPDQLVARLQEWQQLVAELAGTVAQSTELATLYEASQALNSSLDLTETLNAVIDLLIHLTGAERGCLGLYDEDGNLEIRVARNFDQEGNALFDLELSHTVVRETVEKAQPVLTTNAQLDPRFSEQESVVGYRLRSIVCIPLHVRRRVIGALYLDNRIKEGVFAESNLPMLIAFANQAAVAIENARLYTVTDQALAARVEELTTLQQIDRELNASLDFEQVMQLTLSWALRATSAEEGALCILDDEKAVRTVTAGGDGITPPDPEVVRMVTRSHGPLVIGRLRILVPIRCEDRIVGLLDLHSNGSLLFRPEHAQFASRLADHAAVAIENSRLYEAVRQANRAKSEIVSLVAHELYTPMSSIYGYADVLISGRLGELTPQQAEFAWTIRNTVERMQIIVSDLQDVSRIETGQLGLEVKPILLAEALEDALQSTRPQIEARAQHLTVEMSADLPQVRADPARTTQVLVNLLSNACKYTPEDGAIRVRVWRDGSYVYCAVSDTGIGMSSEDRARLFTKFFRSENSAVRETPGTGLGLCIVKNLVELQGGVIAVESELGEGTTFTFTVPVVQEA